MNMSPNTAQKNSPLQIIGAISQLRRIKWILMQGCFDPRVVSYFYQILFFLFLPDPIGPTPMERNDVDSV